ncbi:MAG: alpha/beta fold hydrolase, partial [Candidatus Binatia bacterium]
AVLFASTASAQLDEPACVGTERPDPGRPDLVAEREAFGFHDEEVVICSPGYERATHLGARLWVPRGCEEPRSCPGVLIAHGFAFSKEFTFADMQNAANRGFVVLSYDVRGHGASGDQVGLMGREEIADQAAVLAWFHEHVGPTKVGVYGISQGGSHAVMAAIFNCSPGRAAEFLAGDDFPDASCDIDRWVDAIVPVQAPTTLDPADGVCPTFGIEAVPESRFNLALTRLALRCATRGTPLEEAAVTATEPLPAFDFGPSDYLRPDRAGRIDVPAYLVTSFFDRLVLPQNVTRLYEALAARSDYGHDLRLTISNDGHGAVGGNFAVLNDVFTWLEGPLKDGAPPFRDAPVAIAQEWEGNAFRLEEAWPIPDTTTRRWFLSGTESEANGRLVAQPSESEPPDEMRNVPVVSSPPSVPFTEFVNQITASTSGSGVPLVRLVYRTDPLPEMLEITGLPEVSIWLSSSNEGGAGQGQLHVSLSEIGGDGQVTEFARNRRGRIDLGPEPIEIAFPLTVSS